MLDKVIWTLTGCFALIGIPASSPQQFQPPPLIRVERNWSVTPTAPIGTFVTRAKMENGGPVTFELETSGPPVPFAIDSHTGVVTVNDTLLDKENQTYFLWVKARGDDSSISPKIQVYASIGDEANGSLGPPKIPNLDLWQKPYPGGKVPGFPNFPPDLWPKPNTPSTSISITKATQAPTEENTVPDTASTTASSTNTNKHDDVDEGTTQPSIKVNTTSDQNSPNDVPLTVIPLVAIGGLVVIVALVILFVWKKNTTQKSKSKKDDMSKDSSGIVLQDASAHVWDRPRAYSNRYESWDNNHLQLSEETTITKEEPRDEWEFPRHRLRIFNIVGEGAFGQVWRAQAIDIDGKKGEQTVAVKTLKENASEKEKSDLIQELIVMKNLGPHPNVVRLIGCCTEKEPTLVIMEFVSLGKLQQFLRDSRAERHYGNTHGGSQFLTSRDLTHFAYQVARGMDFLSSKGFLTSRDLTHFAYQVARGMDFLSSKGIIHRDLAARNVLITEERTCKVADFGFARDVGGTHVYERKSDGRLPIRRVSRDVLITEERTCKVADFGFARDVGGTHVYERKSDGRLPIRRVSHNVLITEERTCKVADFGFARDVGGTHVYERKSDGRLPIRWMAPESLYDDIFSVKSDIWSFGVLLWEIVTLGSTPYPGLSAGDVMRKVNQTTYITMKFDIVSVFCCGRSSLSAPLHTLGSLLVMSCGSFGVLLWEIVTLGSTPYPGLSAGDVMRKAGFEPATFGISTADALTNWATAVLIEPAKLWNFGVLLWEIVTLGFTPYPGLSAGDVMRKVLKKDPTEIYNREVKNTVNSCESILQHTKPHFLIQMNPTPPRLHGYYKLHKEDQPIRPVVSYTGAPAYKLAKLANHLYKKLTKFKPTHTVENSIDLIQKIDNIIVPSQAKLVSFDVKNLFPSIPVKDCLKIIDETLCNSSLEAQEVIDLEAILRICLEQNYFLWEGKTYKQIDGLAMGSPLSPLCADIYMDDFEKSVLKSKFKEHIQYWYRYVDDILCLWTGSNETLQELLVHMNSINHNIQLTMELGGETINFLDLTISIKENAHQYKIYRKATYSDNIIHATSRHPDNHKHAAFHAFIHRLVKVPMNDGDFRQELDTIKQIARNNGYEDQLIHNILKRKQKREAEKLSYNATPSEPPNQKKWVKIPYIGPPSEKFKRLLNSDGRKTAFYSTNSLKSIICNNKDKIPMDHQSGIYSLTCDTCDSIYVREGHRLEKPEHCRRELYNIMFYCWEAEPTNRPDFKEVVAMLERLLCTETDYIELERFPDHSYYNLQHLDGEKTEKRCNIMFYCWEAEPTNRPDFKEVVAMLERLLCTETDYIELERFPDHSYYNLQHLDGEKV
ncbi:protein tyrosine kinase domain-containing protein [Phthorimaea operculella]|nr:protein tyrosine kinase domain-containing protein [Phthorimaea operculella]